MKQKIYFTLLSVMFFLATFSVGICVNKKNSDLNALFEANVEALTRAESGSGQMCSQTGRTGNYYMRLCSDCSLPRGYYAMDSVAFCF